MSALLFIIRRTLAGPARVSEDNIIKLNSLLTPLSVIGIDLNAQGDKIYLQTRSAVPVPPKELVTIIMNVNRGQITSSGSVYNLYVEGVYIQVNVDVLRLL